MNEWIGIGNLAADPELSYTQNQNAKCVFKLAINRPRRDGQDQGADFIRVIVWGRRAETCGRYLYKGSKVAVHGTIRTGSYKNQVGVTVYTTDVWADNVEFLTPANQHPAQNSPQEPYPDHTGGYQPQGNNYQPSYNAPSQQNYAPTQGDAYRGTSFSGFDDLPDTFSAAEDDIPF